MESPARHGLLDADIPAARRAEPSLPLFAAQMALICDLVRLQAVAAVPKTPSPAAMPQKQRRFPRSQFAMTNFDIAQATSQPYQIAN